MLVEFGLGDLRNHVVGHLRRVVQLVQEAEEAISIPLLTFCFLSRVSLHFNHRRTYDSPRDQLP